MPDLASAAGVRTHYTDQGSGDAVVLMHGGISGGDAWQGAVEALVGGYRVLVPERRGHGHTPDVDGDYTYPAMADETIAFLDQVVGGPAHLVGYSDGGIVALHVAIARPDLVRSLVPISTNFHVDGLVPGVLEGWESGDPNDEAMAGMREAYAAVSPDGADHWPVLLRKVLRMCMTGPTLTVEDLARISAPALVIAADDDMVDLRHTVTLYEALPDAELAILPGTSHALPEERPADLLRLVETFLRGDAPPRMMPIRRAGQFG